MGKLTMRQGTLLKTASPPKPKPAKTYIPAFDFMPAEGVPGMVTKGFYWLRFPLPFELNHINLWLTEGKNGWSIIDTGFNSEPSVAYWEKIFDENLGGKTVENIFITHFHPDHFGLAGYLAGKTGVIPKMTAGEHDIMRSITDAPEELESVYRPFYAEAGVPPETIEELLLRRFNYRKIVSKPPAKIDIVKIGDTVTLGDRAWKIIGGYGHCPEHACLYNAEDKLFIAGDIVLPDISPNISFFPGSSADPVDDYLKSLENIRAVIPDDVTVFPSHGVPFKGLHRRIGELEQHHQRRFTRLREVMSAGPMSGFEIMKGLFAHRALKTGDLFFALGETLAHIMYDMKRNRIQRESSAGVTQYKLYR